MESTVSFSSVTCLPRIRMRSPRVSEAFGFTVTASQSGSASFAIAFTGAGSVVSCARGAAFPIQTIAANTTAATARLIQPPRTSSPYAPQRPPNEQ